MITMKKKDLNSLPVVDGVTPQMILQSDKDYVQEPSELIQELSQDAVVSMEELQAYMQEQHELILEVQQQEASNQEDAYKQQLSDAGLLPGQMSITDFE